MIHSDFSQLKHRPDLGAAAARRLLERWRIDGEVSPLDSERDQNWSVRVGGGPSYVLKVTNGKDDGDFIDFQQAMMRRLAAAGVPCPNPVPAASGEPWIEVDGHVVWVIDYRPGRRLSEISQPSAALFRNLGGLLGRAALALDGFDHPSAHRYLQWDVQHATEVIDGYRHHITDPKKRKITETVLDRFERHVAPRLADLPRSVIHNDANDHNLLVDGDAITALLDFGDAVHTITVNDLAVACAYAMLDRDDPHAAARNIVDGYVEHRPLSPLEQQVLPDLIRTRLATSVSISAYQQTIHPENDYLGISEAPAWRLLARLEEDR